MELLTPEIRKILQCGLEAGIKLYQNEINHDRDRLGVYAKNTQKRDLFSSLCKALDDTVNKSKSILNATNKVATSTTYVEITTENIIIHVRRSGGEMPNYVKEKLTQNDSWEEGKQLYIQIVYTDGNDCAVEKIEYQIKKSSGESLYTEPISGSWLLQIVPKIEAG